MWSKVKYLLTHHEALIFIICVCALLRLPSLLEPYWYGDEGIYLTLGKGMRQGLELYRDIHDNKPPVIYILAAITGSMFWFRFLLLIWNTASIIVFNLIAKKILDHSHQTLQVFKIFGFRFFPIYPSVIATLLFALLPFAAEGNIANGEIFMVLPTLLGLWYLLKSRITVRSSAISGFFFSLAFLTKVPALFDTMAIGYFFFFITPVFTEKLHWTHLPKNVFTAIRSKYLYVFLFAFLVPIMITIAYYSLIGAGKQYVSGAFAQNIGYLSSWSTGTHKAASVAQSGLKNRAFILILTTIVLTLLGAKMSKQTELLSIWFCFALFAALLSERPYPHYLIQIIPPLILLLIHEVLVLRSKSSGKTQTLFAASIVSLCIGVLVITQYTIKFWHYSIPPYYQNYIQFISGKISRDQYFASFDTRLPEMYRIAAYIVALSDPADRIFIWGDLPTLYALTDRLPPGRYTSAYHIVDFDGYKETLEAIDRSQPKLVVVDTKTGFPFKQLELLLSRDYRLRERTNTLLLYRKLPVVYSKTN